MDDNLLVNVGFGNGVKANRILAVVNPGSAPIRKLKDGARMEHKLIDLTEGRRTRAILILDTGHFILSSVQPETINQRLAALYQDRKNPQDLLKSYQEKGYDE